MEEPEDHEENPADHDENGASGVDPILRSMERADLFWPQTLENHRKTIGKWWFNGGLMVVEWWFNGGLMVV